MALSETTTAAPTARSAHRVSVTPGVTASVDVAWLDRAAGTTVGVGVGSIVAAIPSVDCVAVDMTGRDAG
ncbi:MAG: hypothetical protein ACRD2N_01290 [Vicinamibacterales bacterium]